jgi:hypothetical protein
MPPLQKRLFNPSLLPALWSRIQTVQHMEHDSEHRHDLGYPGFALHLDLVVEQIGLAVG